MDDNPTSAIAVPAIFVIGIVAQSVIAFAFAFFHIAFVWRKPAPEEDAPDKTTSENVSPSKPVTEVLPAAKPVQNDTKSATLTDQSESSHVTIAICNVLAGFCRLLVFLLTDDAMAHPHQFANVAMPFGSITCTAAQAASWLILGLVLLLNRTLTEKQAEGDILRKGALALFFGTFYAICLGCGCPDLLLISQLWRANAFDFGFQDTGSMVVLVSVAIQHSSCLYALLEAINVLRNIGLRSLKEQLASAAATKIVATFGDKATRQKRWTHLKMLIEIVWPKSNRTLQLYILFSLVLLIPGRVLRIYRPLLNKWIIDGLAQNVSGTNDSSTAFSYDLIVKHTALEIAHTVFRTAMFRMVWNNVEHMLELEIKLRLYEHLTRLSLRWHLAKKSGEVLKIIEGNVHQATRLLETTVFELAPQIIDLIIAMYLMINLMGVWFGVFGLVVAICYLGLSTLIDAWRRPYEKKSRDLDKAWSGNAMEALLNIETIKYYNTEAYEIQRYRKQIEDSQAASVTVTVTYYIGYFIETLYTSLVSMAGSLFCARLITDGKSGLTAGDYSLFGTYLSNIQRPIDSFAWYFKSIQRNLIATEKMFDYLQEDIEVKDVTNAAEFELDEGLIEFRNVDFSYVPEKPVLKNVSFLVKPGETLALVGPSGSGKSTIVRLLYRFYDPTTGSVLYDKQDISKVTQLSLRKHIGVVPQDTVLFNDTVMSNIAYGRIGASEADAIEASKAAALHENISALSDGYKTVVGERGLKLSGGEKQRVAIARTVLKGAKFVLLDEATSALDTNTEREIQESLDAICEKRTTVIVAHRLSTVIHADQIIVLKHGEIVEQGRHEDLLRNPLGVYAKMWHQQLNPRKQRARVDQLRNQVDADQSESSAPSSATASDTD